MCALRGKPISLEEAVRIDRRLWREFIDAPDENKAGIARRAIATMRGVLTETGGDEEVRVRRFAYTSLGLLYWGTAKYAERRAWRRSRLLGSAYRNFLRAYDLTVYAHGKCSLSTFIQGTTAYLADTVEATAEKHRWSEMSLDWRKTFQRYLPGSIADFWQPGELWGETHPDRLWYEGHSELFEGYALCVLEGLEESSPDKFRKYRQALDTTFAGLSKCYDNLRLVQAYEWSGINRYIVAYEYKVATQLLRRYLAERIASALQRSQPTGHETKIVLEFLPKAFRAEGLFSSLEEIGWVTLSEISKETEVSRRRLYGNGRADGTVLRELRELKLIEEKSVHGMRGRGGEIHMIRMKP